MKRDEEEYGEEEEEGDFENEWLLNDEGKYEDYEKISYPTGLREYHGALSKSHTDTQKLASY